jgi:hypothetical protein
MEPGAHRASSPVHTQSLDCPCGPVTFPQLGGGTVQIHRGDAGQGERKPVAATCPNCATRIDLGVADPYCSACGTWHLRGNHVGAPVVSRKTLLREIEDEIRALPAEPDRHRGTFIERAAVLTILQRGSRVS